ncbi:hypothetical protein [Candidatus Xianfuyuplasma coldseepsis]|uniref:CBM-cenC domain-containing protein n=1 Tax=Candidatus Xianfuyuplasma coldseepsis TaxID=2782163 RepID=A0A7L7KRH9_9MOLU|nr:hypothetical protein [Xianfuyuplasma coldseepsis]QMS84554.1 hypothetical protein G4Z02_01920 [Xianfuyuplasma coldseepsis]
MKRVISMFMVILTMAILTACDDTTTLECGEGTTNENGVCVAIEDDTEETEDAVVCTNETGLHTVPGGSPSTISEWLNWNFIGGHLVTDPDNAWIIDYGAAIFNVKTTSSRPWEGSFTQSGMFLEAGCEYTFEFTLRTESPNIKPNVIVFGENTSGTSFFEETVDLDINSTTYSFTVEPTTSDYVSTGVYFANSRGVVIIENVQIERNPIGTTGTE